MRLTCCDKGNGVQEAFYEDPNVLYISVHVHMDGRFYPSGPNGDHLHCGKGAGMGKQVFFTPFREEVKLTIHLGTSISLGNRRVWVTQITC